MADILDMSGNLVAFSFVFAPAHTGLFMGRFKIFPPAPDSYNFSDFNVSCHPLIANHILALCMGMEHFLNKCGYQCATHSVVEKKMGEL